MAFTQAFVYFERALAGCCNQALSRCRGSLCLPLTLPPDLCLSSNDCSGRSCQPNQAREGSLADFHGYLCRRLALITCCLVATNTDVGRDPANRHWKVRDGMECLQHLPQYLLPGGPLV